MALLFKKKMPDIDAPAVLDQIEAIVYARLKPLGFRKHGRTLHRFVSGDISQVVNFQYHYYDFYVNAGIRIPECDARTFTIPTNDMKYYRLENCQITTRLGCFQQQKKNCFDLRKNPAKNAGIICDEIAKWILPMFDVLDSREQILAHRKDYRLFDQNSWQSALDETFIYGCRGDLKSAKERFEAYYQRAFAIYERERTEGHLVWLRMGETLVAKDKNGGTQRITAKFPRYFRIYSPNKAHLEYLDELAEKLGIR